MEEIRVRTIEEPSSNVMSYLDRISVDTIAGMTLGSMGLSALFFLMGRRTTAIFVGQWIPSLGMLALVYRLLRPRRVHAVHEEEVRAVEPGAEETGREAHERVVS